MENPNPYDFPNEGVYQVESALDQSKSGLLNELNKKHLLSDWAKDHVMFNYDLFFTKGRMIVNPLKDLNLPADSVYRLELPVSIFNGIGDVSDRTLYACVRELWPKVGLHLHTISGLNLETRFFWQAVTQIIPLLDPFNVKSVAHVNVYTYGVSSNQGLHVFHPSSDVKDFRIKVVHHPAEENVVFASKQYLGEL